MMETDKFIEGLRRLLNWLVLFHVYYIEVDLHMSTHSIQTRIYGMTWQTKKKKSRLLI